MSRSYLLIWCFDALSSKSYSFQEKLVNSSDHIILFSARSSSLFIEYKFQRVSNCRVWTCIKLEFCHSICSFGMSNASFSGFFELEFYWVWVLRFKTHWVFEFWVALSGTTKYIASFKSIWPQLRNILAE